MVNHVKLEYRLVSLKDRNIMRYEKREKLSQVKYDLLTFYTICSLTSVQAPLRRNNDSSTEQFRNGPLRSRNSRLKSILLKLRLVDILPNFSEAKLSMRNVTRPLNPSGERTRILLVSMLFYSELKIM